MTEYGRKHTDGSRSGGQPVTDEMVNRARFAWRDKANSAVNGTINMNDLMRCALEAALQTSSQPVTNDKSAVKDIIDRWYDSEVRQPTQSDATASPHLETVCYKTSDENQSCDRIYNMTDTIPRQAVIDVIAPLTDNGVLAWSQISISRALAAIKAIPAVTVTDDMVERAAKAWCERDDSYSSYGYTAYLRYARELLVAALGE